MSFGTVRYYRQDRGWLFIHETGHPDVFAHIKNVLSDEIFVGSKVSFNRATDKLGRPCAVDVVVLDTEEDPDTQSFVTGKVEEPGGDS